MELSRSGGGRKVHRGRRILNKRSVAAVDNHHGRHSKEASVHSYNTSKEMGVMSDSEKFSSDSQREGDYDAHSPSASINSKTVNSKIVNNKTVIAADLPANYFQDLHHNCRR